MLGLTPGEGGGVASTDGEVSTGPYDLAMRPQAVADGGSCPAPAAGSPDHGVLRRAPHMRFSRGLRRWLCAAGSIGAPARSAPRRYAR